MSRAKQKTNKKKRLTSQAICINVYFDFENMMFLRTMNPCLYIPDAMQWECKRDNTPFCMHSHKIFAQTLVASCDEMKCEEDVCVCLSFFSSNSLSSVKRFAARNIQGMHATMMTKTFTAMIRMSCVNHFHPSTFSVAFAHLFSRMHNRNGEETNTTHMHLHWDWHK